MKRRLSKPVKILIEIALLAALVVLFVVVLRPQGAPGLPHAGDPRLHPRAPGLPVRHPHRRDAASGWCSCARRASAMSPWHVFWSRLSGCAITSLTPSAYFGGEPVRAAMLKNDTMSYRKVFATIAVDKYIELFTKFPIAVLGFGCLIMLAPARATTLRGRLLRVRRLLLRALLPPHGEALPGRRLHHALLQDGPAARSPGAKPRAGREGHPRGARLHQQRRRTSSRARRPSTSPCPWGSC